MEREPLLQKAKLVQLGQYEEALSIYKDVEGAKARYGEGGCLFKLDRLDEAEVALERAIELQPNFPKA